LLDELLFEVIEKDVDFIVKGRQDIFEYFVLSGICRCYLINQEGEEITISFYKEKSVLPPNVTRTSKSYSSLNFQALTNLHICRFKASRLVELMQEYTEWRNFANTVLFNELKRKTDKEVNHASLPAKERLMIFRKEFKNLENLVPHPYIASYLGITNISLSRLRGNLAKK
jgi:CRP-like cAMP-binding protein